MSSVVYYIKIYLLGSTPRSDWGITYGKNSVAWGMLFTAMTLLIVIYTFYYFPSAQQLIFFVLIIYMPWLVYHCAYHQWTRMCRSDEFWNENSNETQKKTNGVLFMLTFFKLPLVHWRMTLAYGCLESAQLYTTMAWFKFSVGVFYICEEYPPSRPSM